MARQNHYLEGANDRNHNQVSLSSTADKSVSSPESSPLSAAPSPLESSSSLHCHNLRHPPMRHVPSIREESEEARDVDPNDRTDRSDEEWRLVIPKTAAATEEVGRAMASTKSSPEGFRDDDSKGRVGKEEEEDGDDDDDGNIGDGDAESVGEWTSCSEPPASLLSEPTPAHSVTSGTVPPTTPPLTAMDYARKSAVAVSGSALVTLGVVMIPLPTPFGCVVAASGMAVLGTEFPSAQRALERTKDSLVVGLERMATLDDDDIDGAGDRVVEGDVVFVRKVRMESGDGGIDGGVCVSVEKGEMEAFEDAIDEAKRTLRRHASRFGKRVLPLVRPAEVKDERDRCP